MRIEKIDITGVHRTQAVFKIMLKTVSLQPGDILEVSGASPTFRKDIHSICERMKKDPVFLETAASLMKCRIQF